MDLVAPGSEDSMHEEQVPEPSTLTRLVVAVGRRVGGGSGVSITACRSKLVKLVSRCTCW